MTSVPLVDCFDAIYVINLVSRPDRRAEIAQQLRTIGLDLDHPKVHLFPAAKPTSAGGFPSIGARGCFTSHLNIVRAALQRQLNSVLIIEDDLNFSADFVQRWPAVRTSLQAVDWAVFYAGQKVPLEHAPEANPCTTLAPEQPVLTTHWIALRGPAMASIAAYFEAILGRPPGDPAGGPMHVDGAYSRFRRDHPMYRTILCVEPLAYQRASRTDIHALRWFDRYWGVRSVAAFARKVRN